MKPVALVLVAAALVAAAVSGAHALTTRSTATAPVAPTTAGFENVNFVALCRFDHYGPDDPIVFPDQPGVSHLHTFFGNATTNAYTRPPSLIGKTTSCDPTTDTSAYWAPTLKINGSPIPAIDAAIYYRRNTYATVKPFPPGFMMIGGDSTSFGPQSTKVVFWGCGLEDTDASVTVPDCGDKSLRLHIVFPECWDGTRLDSPDHKSHMAYAVNGVCPADHPVALPELVVILRYYPHLPAGTITLSSLGNQYSGHADFVNGWNQDALAYLVDHCLNALRPCGARR
jgi:hypothetical protein